MDMKTNVYFKKLLLPFFTGILSLFLVSTLIACQSESVSEDTAPETQGETVIPEVTISETQAPETNAPETEALETNAPETQASETEAPETQAPETETVEAETDVSDPDTLLFKADDGYIVYDFYAAEWEKAAAAELIELLGIKYCEEEQYDLIADLSETPSYDILIGYTGRRGRDYADTLATVGDLGYILKVDGTSVIIMANTESGMRAALDTFKSNLTEVEGGYSHPASFEDICVKNSEKQELLVGEGAWAENLAYAQSLENGVYTEFLDENRRLWKLVNQQAILYYNTSAKHHCYDAITTTEGIPYVKNTGYVYLISEEGKEYNVKNAYNGARTNTYELGYYFYNAHVMGATFGGRSRTDPMLCMTLDRTFYMYSDKLNAVQHFVADSGDVTGMASYGQYFDIPEYRVQGILIKVASGFHDSLDGVDWTTAEYVGFDIERAGIFGIILVKDAGSGQLTVTLENGIYHIDQRVTTDPTTVYTKGTHIYMGQRIYTDTNHDFDKFKAEAEAERNPLTEVGLHEDAYASGYLYYDALRGVYKYLINGNGFVGAYYQDPDTHYKVHPQITCDDMDRTIYVMSQTISGALENAVILDENGNLLPLAAEVCKNFQGENEESTYDPGDVSYGRTYVPITLKAGETKKFTIINLYQNWGKFPLKQLSSVQFTSPYYHLSTGVTETNCIAPTFVYGRDNWLLPDFRSMSAPLWASQPQHTAVGGLYVFDYCDAENKLTKLENSTDHIDSYGPVYADVTMDYKSIDSRIEATYRHVEMPQTDENRAYYEIDIRVNEDISFNDFKMDFYLFRFHSRLWHFSKLGYLDENNQHQIVDCVYGSGENRLIKLGTEAPYYEYHACSDPNNNDYVNFALIVKDFSAVIGGEDYTGNLMIRDFYHDKRNFGDLTLDLEEVTLKAGDYITLKIILLPWGSQLSTDNQNVLNVREDSVLNPYALSVSAGTVIPDTYVPKVMVDDSGKAEFTITGGNNTAAILIYGLSDYAKPAIEELVDGEWITYDTTFHPYDGYMVYNDGDGTYSIAFCVDMTGVGEGGRSFRVVD